MAITTLDGAIAGMQAPQPIIKTGIATAAVGAMRGYSLWYAAGNPGAATANSAGGGPDTYNYGPANRKRPKWIDDLLPKEPEPRPETSETVQKAKPEPISPEVAVVLKSFDALSAALAEQVSKVKASQRRAVIEALQRAAEEMQREQMRRQEEALALAAEMQDEEDAILAILLAA